MLRGMGYIIHFRLHISQGLVGDDFRGYKGLEADIEMRMRL
jgi:hypothetical protein